MNLTLEELEIIRRPLCGCQHCRTLFKFSTDNDLFQRVIKEIREWEHEKTNTEL